MTKLISFSFLLINGIFITLYLPSITFAQTAKTPDNGITKEIKYLKLNLQDNKISEVLLQAEALKNKNPQNLEIREILFEVYLQSNLLQKAEEELLFIENRRRNSRVAYNRGRLLFKQQKNTESEAVALNILASDIRFADAYLLLKDIAISNKLIDKANAYLNDYQKIEGRNQTFLQNKIKLQLEHTTSQKIPTAEKIKLAETTDKLLNELGTKFQKEKTYFYLLATHLININEYPKSLAAINQAIAFNSFNQNFKMLKAEILFRSHAYTPLIEHFNKILQEKNGLILPILEKKRVLVLQGFIHFIKDKISGNDWNVANTEVLANTTIPILLAALEIEPEDEKLRFFIEQLAKKNLPSNHPLRIQLSEFPHTNAVEALQQGKNKEANEWFLQALSLNPQNATLRINYKKYLMYENLYLSAQTESEIINELSDGEYLKNYKNSINLELLKKKNIATEMHNKNISIGTISADKKNKIILAYKSLNWNDYFSMPYFDIIMRDMLINKLSTSWLVSIEFAEEDRLEYNLTIKNPHYYIKYTTDTTKTEMLTINLEMIEKKTRQQVLNTTMVFSGNKRYFNISQEVKNRILETLPLVAKVLNITHFRLLVSLGRIHGLDANKKYEASIILSNGTNAGNAANLIGPFPLTKIEEIISQVEVRNFFELPKIKLGMHVIINEKPNP